MYQDIIDDGSLSESGFKKNSALQLVLGIASMYILFQIIVLVLMILSEAPRSIFYSHILPYTAIKDFDLLIERPYALLTYTFCNKEFLVLFANCIWLYVCGKAITARYHFQEVIPSYIFISILSAILYSVVLKLAGIQPQGYIYGGFSTLIGLSIPMVMGPKLSFKINENLHIPYWIIFIIILAFSLLQFDLSSAGTWVLIGTSYLTGVLYFILVKMFSFGEKIYNTIEKISAKLSPEYKDDDVLGWDIEALFTQIREKHPKIPAEKLDDLFNKIKANGFKSLSIIEKKIFFRLMND